VSELEALNAVTRTTSTTYNMNHHHHSSVWRFFSSQIVSWKQNIWSMQLFEKILQPVRYRRP